MVAYKVYGLKASDEESIKYVGVTSISLARRLKYHYLDLQNNVRTKWIKSVRNRGCKVEIVLLDEDIPMDSIFQKEIEYIRMFKSFGAVLKNGTLGGDKPPIGMRSIKVRQLNLETGEVVATYNSMKDAAKQLGIARSAITAVCKGEYSQAAGFKWEKVNKV